MGARDVASGEPFAIVGVYPHVAQVKVTANAAEGALEQVDPELVALPAPPRARRYATMTVMAFVVAVASALALSLRADISYYFSSARAVDLGAATEIVPATLGANAFVRIHGTPMASKTVHFQRVLGNDAYAVFPLAGQRTVFVQVPEDDPDQTRRLARGEFSGRLVTFGQLGGRFSAVREYLRDTMGIPVSSESYLLLADEPPAAYGWSLGLFGLCLAFILLNFAMLLRWFRPLRAPAEDAADDPAPR